MSLRARNSAKPKRIGRRQPAVIPSTRIDIWISRVASISQILIVLLTVGGFYFTVLPLYQKALLDEAIARKEIELREVSASLEKSYARVRFGALKEYIFYSGVSCSGLLLPASTLHLIGKPNPDRRPYAQQILEINPQNCLVSALEKHRALEDLRPEDMKILRNTVAKIALELDHKRTSLAAESANSWESKHAVDNAEEYVEFVKSQVNSLRTLQWE